MPLTLYICFLLGLSSHVTRNMLKELERIFIHAQTCNKWCAQYTVTIWQSTNGTTEKHVWSNILFGSFYWMLKEKTSYIKLSVTRKLILYNCIPCVLAVAITDEEDHPGKLETDIMNSHIMYYTQSATVQKSIFFTPQ